MTFFAHASNMILTKFEKAKELEPFLEINFRISFFKTNVSSTFHRHLICFVFSRAGKYDELDICGDFATVRTFGLPDNIYGFHYPSLICDEYWVEMDNESCRNGDSMITDVNKFMSMESSNKDEFRVL